MRHTAHMSSESRVARGICILFLIAGSVGVSRAQSPLFRTTPKFAVGDGPAAIARCDLNEDGFPDVITADRTFSDVAVLRSDGEGGFLPQVRFGVGQSPEDIVCADLNGDDRIDAVTCNFDDDTVSILRGNGDGTFMVGAVTLTVQDRPLSVAVGLFDADDIPDIAIGSDSRIEVRLGLGSYAYQEAPDILEGASEMSVSDVDADGTMDLLIVRRNAAEAKVLWGNGDGTFAVLASLRGGSEGEN